MTITKDSLTFFGGPEAPRRTMGRPKVQHPRVPISSRLTATEYDDVAKAARLAGVSVAAFVRSAIRSALSPLPTRPRR